MSTTSITLELEEEVWQQIQESARKQGVSENEVVTSLVHRMMGGNNEDKPLGDTSMEHLTASEEEAMDAEAQLADKDHEHEQSKWDQTMDKVLPRVEQRGFMSDESAKAVAQAEAEAELISQESRLKG